MVSVKSAVTEVEEKEKQIFKMTVYGVSVTNHWRGGLGMGSGSIIFYSIIVFW